MQPFKPVIGRWAFKPGLASTLTSLFFIPIFIYLGFWQLGRMHFKNELQEQHESQMQATPLDMSMVNDISLLRFRSLQVTGHFLNDYPILLDNQIYQGRAGYRIIMPFQIQTPSIDPYPLLLVDRGWVPMDINRSKLPDIEPIFGEITLTGVLNNPPKPLTLSAPTEVKNIQFPLLIQAVHFHTISEQLKQTIYPILLILPTQSPYAYQSLPITFGMPATRHLGYAVQWFAMALAVFVYYCVLNIKKK